MRKAFFATLFLFVFAILSHAQQQQTPPAPPQSPRQALIEIANGQVEKHLTVEVQQLLKQPENKQALVTLGFASSLKRELGQDVQLFESGPVLLSINDAKEHRKIEVQVNNDDMSGDQDVLELSIHSFRDGVEQDEEWQTFLSHFTVTMVRQQTIWRLSKIGIGVELAVGDPEFLKKTYLKSINGGGMGATGAGLDVHTTDTAGEKPQHREMKPNLLLFMMGIAEQSYARQHPDIGFTCSLVELKEGSNVDLNPQIVTGSYNGYKISLTGCQGKPAGSFTIVMEPVAGTTGKAYCLDATQNRRVADNGNGATCLSSGRPDDSVMDQEGTSFGGYYTLAPSPATKSKD